MDRPAGVTGLEELRFGEDVGQTIQVEFAGDTVLIAIDVLQDKGQDVLFKGIRARRQGRDLLGGASMAGAIQMSAARLSCSCTTGSARVRNCWLTSPPVSTRTIRTWRPWVEISSRCW